MHCPGHNTVGGSQLASEGWYFRRVKNNVPYLRGTIRWRRMTRKSLLITNSRSMFLHNAWPICFSIHVWAFIRGSILGKFAWKISFFGIQTGEWASIRACASNRDFTVLPAVHHCEKTFWEEIPLNFYNAKSGYIMIWKSLLFVLCLMSYQQVRSYGDRTIA